MPKPRSRCEWCGTGMWRSGQDICPLCDGAIRVIEDAWPEKEVTPELVERVRVHRKENNSLQPTGRSVYEKQHRKILREQKQLCRDRFVGKRVEWWAKGGPGGRDVVESVKIHHGQIFYHMEGRDKGVKRHQLRKWKVLEAEPEAVHA